jgi:hypothetical protein
MCGTNEGDKDQKPDKNKKKPNGKTRYLFRNTHAQFLFIYRSYSERFISFFSLYIIGFCSPIYTKSVIRMPIRDPKYTSTQKCSSRYIRDMPTKDAAHSKTILAQERLIYMAIKKKTAKATAVCPDGKLYTVRTGIPSTK